MTGREFLDTNVLIYAHDGRDPRKQTCARDLIRRLLRERRGVLSLQVLQEFFAAATRKLGMSSEDARRRIVQYSRFDVVTLGVADLVAAIDLHRLHHVSLWDALVVRAALNGACTTLHTEDMQSGYVVETLTLRNPFPKHV
ncbi:MAG: PIN domain-containing protein [Acidobacteria bacterium]|nr:PIN domain-containing protein [Acidobacteriota bacterium]